MWRGRRPHPPLGQSLLQPPFYHVSQSPDETQKQLPKCLFSPTSLDLPTTRADRRSSYGSGASIVHRGDSKPSTHSTKLKDPISRLLPYLIIRSLPQLQLPIVIAPESTPWNGGTTRNAQSHQAKPTEWRAESVGAPNRFWQLLYFSSRQPPDSSTG